MDLIEWNEKYSVGSGGIDGEHKKLFSLINDLNRAMGERTDKGAGEKILLSLLEYTEYHFGNEEEILAKYSYSQLEQHKIAHKGLIGKVKELMDRVSRGREVTGDMLMLLEEWICQHILLVDRHYSEELAPYLRAE